MKKSTREWLLGGGIVLGVLTIAGIVLGVSLENFDAELRAKRANASVAPDPRSTLTGVALGEHLFQRFGCQGCHGPGGEGGVVNPNAIRTTNPALDVMAERLMLFDEEDAQRAVELLGEGADLEALRSDPPFRTYPRFLAQLESVRTVIRGGSMPGKADPNGPDPVAMPAWGAQLEPREIDALIAYLITLYPWEE